MPLNLAYINLSLNRYDYGGVAGVEYGYDGDDDHADDGTPSF